MARTSTRSRTRAIATGLAAVGVLMAAACGGDEGDGDATPVPPTVTVDVPDMVDEVCDDPTGDLSTLAVEQGALSEPAGIDLVRGEVHLDPDTLRVVVETNGDLVAAPDPTVTVFQGPPGLLASWELRMAPAEGGWTTTLITYEPGDGRILVDEVREPLPAAPRIEGSTLTLDVPRLMVPPPLTLAWVFGTSSTVADEALAASAESSDSTQDPLTPTTEREVPTVTTFDECDTLFTDAIGGTSTTTSP